MVTQNVRRVVVLGAPAQQVVCQGPSVDVGTAHPPDRHRADAAIKRDGLLVRDDAGREVQYHGPTPPIVIVPVERQIFGELIG
jgi:hypothetical protein